MDGLDDECPPFEPRTVTYTVAPDAATLDSFAGVLDRAKNVAVVAGEKVDAANANADVVKLAERLKAGVFLQARRVAWVSRQRTNSTRAGATRSHGSVSERLAPYDAVLVLVFLYYPYVPGARHPRKIRRIARAANHERPDERVTRGSGRQRDRQRRGSGAAACLAHEESRCYAAATIGAQAG